MTKDEWIKKLEEFTRSVRDCKINPDCQIHEDQLLEWKKLDAEELLHEMPLVFSESIASCIVFLLFGIFLGIVIF